MDALKNSLYSIAVLFISIYLGAKAFLLAFFPEVVFTVFHAWTLVFLYVVFIFLVAVFAVIIDGFKNQMRKSEELEDKVENSARKLLIAAILSNEGFLNIQSQYYIQVEKGNREYTLDTTKLLDGVYQLKIKEAKEDGKKNSTL